MRVWFCKRFLLNWKSCFSAGWCVDMYGADGHESSRPLQTGVRESTPHYTGMGRWENGWSCESLLTTVTLWFQCPLWCMSLCPTVLMQTVKALHYLKANLNVLHRGIYCICTHACDMHSKAGLQYNTGLWCITFFVHPLACIVTQLYTSVLYQAAQHQYCKPALILYINCMTGVCRCTHVYRCEAVQHPDKPGRPGEAVWLWHRWRAGQLLLPDWHRL